MYVAKTKTMTKQTKDIDHINKYRESFTLATKSNTVSKTETQKDKNEPMDEATLGQCKDKRAGVPTLKSDRADLRSQI